MEHPVPKKNPTKPIRERINPYMVYRNPADDKVMLALQQAAKECREQGKPLFQRAGYRAELLSRRRRLLSAFDTRRAERSRRQLELLD